MKNKRVWVLALALMGWAGSATAQSPTGDDCPGFRNPTSFQTYNPDYFWSARVGERVSTSMYSDTTTGYYIMSTCAATNAQTIEASNITSTSYNSGDDGGGGIQCCGHGSIFDANDKRFQIYTSLNAGLDQFTVNGTNGMQRIPAGYTSSIRLGDPRASGNSTASHSWASGSNKGAEALFYTMVVTPFNSLLFVNYAVVARCYDHQTYQAGEFLIRVVKKTNGVWPNQPINDSLWFKVSAPPIPSSGIPNAPWVYGRPGTSCGSTTCAYVYKPWTKVAISLDKYIYDTVRIEMYTSDCIYDVDPIYAYITGDYQSMTMPTTGCPDPESGVIDTVIAPSEMISYQWFVAKNGYVSNIYDYDAMDTVEFVQIYPETGVTTENIYTPVLEDFVLRGGPNVGDTVGKQTFMCIMTSAMNPLKPVKSRLYANVENQKPMLRYSYEADCEQNVTFTSTSMSFVMEGLDHDSTYWAIYTDTNYTTLLDTVHGATATYHFPAGGVYGAILHCESMGTDCASEERFPVKVKSHPDIAMQLSKHILCDGETLTLQCTGGTGMEKAWTVGNKVYNSSDSNMLDMLQVEMSVGEFPITLTVRNEDSCVSTVMDTVVVYGTPVMTAGATAGAICVGDSVTINAAGSISYQWYSSPTDSTLASQQGQPVITVWPEKTTVYSLLPVEGNPCSDRGVDITIEVIPYPVPNVRVNRSRVTFDEPELTFTDISNDRAYTYWYFSDGGSAEGSPVRHSFSNFDVDSVEVMMVSCNRLGCCDTTVFYLPVGNFSIWFPNAFTPDLDNNNRFGIISTDALYEYELYVYNRWGMLVFQSTDESVRWDGTDLNGNKCPQGAYAFYYRYAIDAKTGHHEGKGTVTLIR